MKAILVREFGSPDVLKLEEHQNLQPAKCWCAFMLPG